MCYMKYRKQIKKLQKTHDSVAAAFDLLGRKVSPS